MSFGKIAMLSGGAWGRRRRDATLEVQTDVKFEIVM